MAISFRVMPAYEANNLLYRDGRRSILLILLFGGDRLSVCDEVAVAMEGDVLAGLASIAPDGESAGEGPTIVGLYTFPAFRRQGVGAAVFAQALERCRERGFARVRVDALSSRALAMLHKHFAVEIASGVLDVRDMGDAAYGLLEIHALSEERR